MTAFYKQTTGGEEPETPVVTVAKPTITVEGKTVSIAAEEGAEVYYTLDGTEPTVESTLYEAPFTVAESCTVKAIAVKDEFVSEVASQGVVVLVGDGTKENPYTVEDVKALNNSGETAWVKGYILGSASSATKLNAEDKAVDTNIAIAATADAETFIPVALTGDLRAELGVKTNPENVGKEVLVYGTLDNYFSTTGVKNVTDYELIGGEVEPEPEILFTTENAMIGAMPNLDEEGNYNFGGTDASQITAYSDYLVIANFLGVEGCNLRCDYAVDPETDETFVYSVSLDGAEASEVRPLDDGNMGIGGTSVLVGEREFVFGMGMAEVAVTSGYVLLNMTEVKAEGNVQGYYYAAWGELATAIREAQAQANGKAVYNLAGQRVNAAKGGLYIINGTKAVVK